MAVLGLAFETPSPFCLALSLCSISLSSYFTYFLILKINTSQNQSEVENDCTVKVIRRETGKLTKIPFKPSQR